MRRRSTIALPPFRDTGEKEHRPRQEPLFLQDHPRPKTRREFLAQGFLAGAATVMSPSLFGLLGKSGNDAMHRPLRVRPLASARTASRSSGSI